MSCPLRIATQTPLNRTELQKQMLATVRDRAGPVLHLPRAPFSFRLRLRHVKSRDHKHRNVHANVSRCDTRLRADHLAPSIHGIAVLPSLVSCATQSKRLDHALFRARVDINCARQSGSPPPPKLYSAHPALHHLAVYSPAIDSERHAPYIASYYGDVGAQLPWAHGASCGMLNSR